MGKEDYPTVQLLGLILELLSFCVEHHTYHIKNYILNRDLLRRILVLMRSRHTFLVLSALRFLRNNGRYNLLDSAILELFEFIKMEDIKSLCVYVVDTFGRALDKVEYVQTFKCLRLCYDQQQERITERSTSALDSVPSLLRTTRFRRDPRQLEEEEEMWFNSEDDDQEENGAEVATFSPSSVTSPASPLSSSSKSSSNVISPKTNQSSSSGSNSPVIASSYSNGGTSSPSLSPTTSPTPPLSDVKSPSTLKKALVDYEGDSEEEEEEEGASCSAAASSSDTVPSCDVAVAVVVDSVESTPKDEEGEKEQEKEQDHDDESVESPNKRAKLT